MLRAFPAVVIESLSPLVDGGRYPIKRVVGEDVVVEALRLTEAYGLRGYDAIQLSAALEANSERVGRGLLPLILVSADTELNNAAQAEGLVIEDPNNYP